MHTFLANAVLLTHAAFVAFVVLTVPLALVGRVLHWRWVRNYQLRVIHLLGIIIVTAQAWAGVICPLTTLEMWLRRNADLTTYAGGFIEYWLQKLLYWDFPGWVFTVIYSLFALLVIGTWYLVPPEKNN